MSLISVTRQRTHAQEACLAFLLNELLPQGLEANEQFEDLPSHNFASTQGDSGMSSISSSSGSLTEVAATTMPGTESFDQAPRDRLRQRDHGHRFSPSEGKSPEIFGDTSMEVTKLSISSDACKRNSWCGKRAMRQQISVLKHQCLQLSSTQLNAEFRVMEHDTSAFHRIQMQEFAIQAEEATDAQRRLCIQEAGEAIRRHADASGTMVNYLESRLRNLFWESSTISSVEEAIESHRKRLQNQDEAIPIQKTPSRSFQTQSRRQ